MIHTKMPGGGRGVERGRLHQFRPPLVRHQRRGQPGGAGRGFRRRAWRRTSSATWRKSHRVTYRRMAPPVRCSSGSTSGSAGFWSGRNEGCAWSPTTSTSAAGMDGRTSTPRIADVLREVGADVIALQEVMGHQAEAISAELGAAVRASARIASTTGYAYGNVVLSRLPIRGARNYDLSVARPRGARLPARRPGGERRMRCCTCSTSTWGRRW